MYTDLQSAQSQSLASLDAHQITSFSHEIRTPLSIIIMSAELLKEHGHKCSEDQRHAYLHQIHLAARQMSQTLNEILAQFDQDIEAEMDQNMG